MFKISSGLKASALVLLVLAMAIVVASCKKSIPAEAKSSQPDKTVAPEPEVLLGADAPAEAVNEEPNPEPVF